MKRQRPKPESFELQIIIPSGIRNIERATLGMAMALSCSYTGTKVVVFLTMEAAIFAYPNEGKTRYVRRFDSIARYIDMLLEAGVRVEVCSSCAKNYCPPTSRKEKTANTKMKAGLFVAGLTTASIRAAKIPTLIF